MKDGRILGGFTRKSYRLLHARASCCELADELTLSKSILAGGLDSKSGLQLPAARQSVEPSECSGWFARTDRAQTVAGIPPGYRADRLPLDFGGRARDEHTCAAGFRSCGGEQIRAANFSPDGANRPAAP